MAFEATEVVFWLHDREAHATYSVSVYRVLQAFALLAGNTVFH